MSKTLQIAIVDDEPDMRESISTSPVGAASMVLDSNAANSIAVSVKSGGMCFAGG